jgi:hypothetical protein
VIARLCGPVVVHALARCRAAIPKRIQHVQVDAESVAGFLAKNARFRGRAIVEATKEGRSFQGRNRIRFRDARAALLELRTDPNRSDAVFEIVGARRKPAATPARAHRSRPRRRSAAARASPLRSAACRHGGPGTPARGDLRVRVRHLDARERLRAGPHGSRAGRRSRPRLRGNAHDPGLTTTSGTCSLATTATHSASWAYSPSASGRHRRAASSSSLRTWCGAACHIADPGAVRRAGGASGGPGSGRSRGPS